MVTVSGCISPNCRHTHAWSWVELTSLWTLLVSPLIQTLLLNLPFVWSSSLCAVILKIWQARFRRFISVESQVRQISPLTIELPLDLHTFPLIPASFSLSVWAGRLLVHSHIGMNTLSGRWKIPLCCFCPPTTDFSALTMLQWMLEGRLCVISFAFCHISGDYFLSLVLILMRCLLQF